jgi:hypothetical protein
VRRCDKALAELRRLQDEAARRAEEEADAWADGPFDAWADRLQRENGGSLCARPPAESAGARPTPQPRQEAAAQPEAAADATARPAPVVVATPTAPKVVAPSPRAGALGGSGVFRLGPGRDAQKAAHRTLQ